MQGTKHRHITESIYDSFVISMVSAAMLTGCLKAAVRFQTIDIVDLGLGNASVAKIGAVTQSAILSGCGSWMG